jgi:hypothetical protein
VTFSHHFENLEFQNYEFANALLVIRLDVASFVFATTNSEVYKVAIRLDVASFVFATTNSEVYKYISNGSHFCMQELLIELKLRYSFKYGCRKNVYILAD